MIEAYANYGFPGILGLGVVLGLFFGWVGGLSQGVPLLSFRFLLAVAVLSGTLASNNTGGVFVTTIWQSFLALATFSLLLMRTVPNPLFVKAGAGRKMGVGSWKMGDGETENRGQRTEDSGLPSSNSGSSSAEQPEAAQVRHERPKRFVYGGKK